MKRILFVCTGNTCRSPMAEGMLKRMAERRGLKEIEVRSAGVAAEDGSPVSAHAAAVLRDKQFHEALSSKPLTESAVHWADLVLTMTSGHKRHTIQQFPQAIDKTFTLKEYVNLDQSASDKLLEMQSLISEFQLKQALGKPVSDEEKRRLMLLERELPSPDIADPFGGSLDTYRRCADEIELCLERLLDKLQSGK